MEDVRVLTHPLPLERDPSGGRYVVIIGLDAEGRVAFIRSAEAGRSWELPGGSIKEGESVLDAATREFLEETGWQLTGVVEVARIDNVATGGHEVHSHAFVVAGSVTMASGRAHPDGESQEWAWMRASPAECTFGREWVDELIRLGIERLAATNSWLMWNLTAASYDDATDISEDEVHYGPLIPGESGLRLLPPVAGTRVLDLGCGAGHNLAALKHAGAASGVGIDYSREQVRRARVRVGGEAFQIVEADLRDLTFLQYGPFDLALSIFSIAFVADARVVLYAAAQSLRPGGTLVLSTDHPCRVGTWRGDYLHIPDWYGERSRIRNWTMPDQQSVPYLHHLHDLSTLVDAIASAGLVLEAALEPRALPLANLAEAPYRSAYHEHRHEELLRTPYTLLLKARKPGP